MLLSIKSFAIILLVVALVVFTGLFFRTLKKLKQKHFRAGVRNGIYTLLVLFIVIVSALLTTNILTYHRLTHETPVVQLHIEKPDIEKPDIEKRANQYFQVSIIYLKDCHSQFYLLKGDEWQLDARIIKWHSWANLLGLDALYQLDRIQGRYQSIQQQRQTLPTVFKLEKQPEVDLWTLKKHYQWLPLLDAEYGQSVYMTMKPEQWYEVYLTQSGLIARKINPPELNHKCTISVAAKDL